MKRAHKRLHAALEAKAQTTADRKSEEDKRARQRSADEYEALGVLGSLVFSGAFAPASIDGTRVLAAGEAIDIKNGVATIATAARPIRVHPDNIAEAMRLLVALRALEQKGRACYP